MTNDKIIKILIANGVGFCWEPIENTLVAEYPATKLPGSLIPQIMGFSEDGISLWCRPEGMNIIDAVTYLEENPDNTLAKVSLSEENDQYFVDELKVDELKFVDEGHLSYNGTEVQTWRFVLSHRDDSFYIFEELIN